MAVTKEQVQTIFAKLSSDHPNEFFSHVAENVQWDVLGTHPLAGHYTTKQEFQEATFTRLGRLFSGTLKLYTRAVIMEADAEQAAVELYTRDTTQSGVPFNNEYCWVCRFQGDQIVQVRAYLDSALVAKVIEAG